MNMWNKMGLLLLAGLAGCGGPAVNGPAAVASSESGVAEVADEPADRPVGLLHFKPPQGWKALHGGEAAAPRWVEFEGLRVTQLAPIMLVEAEVSSPAIAHVN